MLLIIFIVNDYRKLIRIIDLFFISEESLVMAS